VRGVAVVGGVATCLLVGYALHRVWKARVTSVTLSPASPSVPAGARRRLTATVGDASGRTLTDRAAVWSSSNPGVATVSPAGVVTGRAAGTATITATTGRRSGTALVTVRGVSNGWEAFQSDWSTATGTSIDAVTDGGRWMNYWEFNRNTGVRLLSVVPDGPPGYANALKVLQRGSTYAANVQQDSVVPPSTDYYVRFYMRNDDTSSAGDHVVTVDTWKYANLTFLRKWGEGAGWRFVVSLYGCGFTYPIGHWGPKDPLSRGVWYRFEYYVHFVDATHVQLHPRVYEASCTQILKEVDFRQQDCSGGAGASWKGRSYWTLASYYAAGYSFCVNPAPLTSFGMGNNGQQGALDTGLTWYFAGVQIRTDRWPGP
jgi:hypothetical protein